MRPRGGASECGNGLSTETIAAVNGAVIAGLERNLAGFAAIGANGVVHLTVTATATTGAGSPLAGVTARFAALGLIVEALLSKELLLSGCESELLSAILADDCLVLEHVIPL